MNNYYVYQLVDPRTNKPFYIGEGKEKRAWSHLSFKSGCVNPHKDRIIQKIQALGLEVIVELIHINLTKKESELLEEQVISNIGLANLTNITPNAHPPILKGADNGFYNKTHTEENRKKCGDANRGKNNKTPQGSAAIAQSMVERWADPVQRANQIQALKNRKGEKRSDAAKESYKKSAAERNANMTAEQRSARTKAGAETKKIKYAGLKRQRYTDVAGKIHFRWIPAID
jgi:hypothetical protein